MVDDINEAKITSSGEGNDEKEAEELPALTKLQEALLDNCKMAVGNESSKKRKTYFIDEEIAVTLRNINMENLSISDLINVILRTVLTQNEEFFKMYYEEKKGIY